MNDTAFVLEIWIPQLCTESPEHFNARASVVEFVRIALCLGVPMDVLTIFVDNLCIIRGERTQESPTDYHIP